MAEPTDSDAAARALNRAASSGKKATTPRKKQAPSPTRGVGRDPELLGSAVDRLIRDRGWAAEACAASLTTRWAEIVGPDLADHVQPESFEEGVLVLRAESTSWATQVRLLMGTVRTAIDQAIGAGVVTKVTVKGPTAPSWKSGPRSVPGRGPRDTYG
jgi:predicted nucleic acid-binding Zn ribbon protein